MPLFSRAERKKEERIEAGLREYFQLINGYQAKFKTFDGGVYEMELTRAAIDFFARQVSKAKPVVKGSGNQQIERILQNQPNSLMDTKKYLYKLATITEVKNNAIIAPIWDAYYQKIEGFLPLHPDKCEMKKDKNGNCWIQYEFFNGNKGVAKLEECGRLTQYQNKDDLWGESNRAMLPTLQLMDAQNQAIVEAVRNSSNIKFLAKLGQSLRQADVEAERERFVKNNLSENGSGVMLIDAKYAEVKQLQSNQFTIDDKQMQLIRENVFDYFGVSENLLQSKFSTDEYNNYFEAKIEPFLIELGLVHTNMLFNQHEVAFGNRVVFTSNRLNALPMDRRTTIIQTLFDRGLMTPNEARECLDMDIIDSPDADKFFLRKEYGEVYSTETSTEGEENNDSN